MIINRGETRGDPHASLRVDLPLALPAIMAGIRIATVTTIGSMLATVGIGLIYTFNVHTATGKWIGCVDSWEIRRLDVLAYHFYSLAVIRYSYVEQLYKSGYYQQMQAKYGAFPMLSVQQIALDQPRLVSRNGKPAAAS